MISTNDLTTSAANLRIDTDSSAALSQNVLTGSSALVLVPGTVNYFYNVEGKRLAEALTNLGCQATLSTLDSYAERKYDWCFLFNLYEIDFAYRDRSGFLRQIQKLKSSCNFVIPALLESVQTKWFNDSIQIMAEAQLRTILDLGFENQQALLPDSSHYEYRSLFNGLTKAERLSAKSLPSEISASERPIPWAFVGQATGERLRLVERLVQEYDPAGFVYLVRHVPYQENGPHLGGQQLNRVLQSTRYKIWCSHHPYYYLESIRFRLALTNGCVPVKIIAGSQNANPAAPFSSLIFSEMDWIDRLRALDFETARRDFVAQFLSLPSLESSVSALLSKWGTKS